MIFYVYFKIIMFGSDLSQSMHGIIMILVINNDESEDIQIETTKPNHLTSFPKTEFHITTTIATQVFLVVALTLCAALETEGLLDRWIAQQRSLRKSKTTNNSDTVASIVPTSPPTSSPIRTPKKTKKTKNSTGVVPTAPSPTTVVPNSTPTIAPTNPIREDNDDEGWCCRPIPCMDLFGELINCGSGQCGNRGTPLQRCYGD